MAKTKSNNESSFFDEELRQKTKDLYQEAQEKIAQQEAEKLNLEYLDANRAKVQLEALRLIDEEDAREYHFAAIQIRDEKLIIITTEPLDSEEKEILLPLRKKYNIDTYFVSPQGFFRVLEFYKQIPKPKELVAQKLEIGTELLEKYQRQIKTLDSLRKKLAEFKEKQKTSQVLEIIFGGALAIEASDIHIEPKESEATIKFRVDGLLQDVSIFNKRIFELITNRLKLLSGMKLNIKDSPQDGRFSIKTLTEEIEIRSSSVPGPNGENIVLRILDPKIVSLDVRHLGLYSFEEEIIRKELRRPNGLILVTGPTGSGKTTTLYAFLKEAKKEPGVKIITIEDPIEYHLEGIEQTQIDEKKGYDFENGLKAILRQDPDIILVGEMRDLETVQTALHASLTGHLVFSTLHTNDSASIIPRLIDLGAQIPIIAPSINIGIAQRLVRKVCSSCSTKAEATKEQMMRMKQALEKMPEVFIKRPQFSESEPPQIAQTVGCSICNETGYKGRVGIFEFFVVDDEVEQLITTKPSEIQIRELARKKGMITLKENGILKVLQGITTLEEVERVIG